MHVTSVIVGLSSPSQGCTRSQEGHTGVLTGRGLGCGACPGLTDTPPPKPPAVLHHPALFRCSHGLLRCKRYCRTGEPQFYSVSPSNTRLSLPGRLCPPRAQPGDTLSWDGGACPCPQTRGSSSSCGWPPSFTMACSHRRAAPFFRFSPPSGSQAF